jgi:hypothetical protein
VQPIRTKDSNGSSSSSEYGHSWEVLLAHSILDGRDQGTGGTCDQGAIDTRLDRILWMKVVPVVPSHVGRVKNCVYKGFVMGGRLLDGALGHRCRPLAQIGAPDVDALTRLQPIDVSRASIYLGNLVIVSSHSVQVCFFCSETDRLHL